MSTSTADVTIRGAGPLYAQVRDLLTARIGRGELGPGELIPGESRLADELGVSKGTVRKAIDALVADNLLVRQQGVGTFVAVHDRHRALFHFFHMVGIDGSRVLPESRLVRCQKVRASRDEARALGLAAGERVVRIERVRDLDGRPTICETVSVALARFPDLAGLRELPNTLYELYEREYGTTIHRADESLSAVAASARDARALGCEPGQPLLEIERVARTVDGTPVERRVSRCLTARHRYHSSIV